MLEALAYKRGFEPDESTAIQGTKGDPTLTMALEIDRAVKEARPDAWRDVQSREMVIKRALYDVLLEVSDAALSDRIEDTVDYREVAARVREVSDSRSFQLIEALAGAVADALADSFPVQRVRVRVRKPGVRPGGLQTEYSAATVERAR